MDGVLYAVFGFVGVFVGGAFSYWGIKTQIEHSDKRFEKELARAREEIQQKRRWEVRSKPLLKLRHELATMATKLNMLVIDTRGQHYRSGITEEEKNKELERAVENLKVFGTSEDFLQTANLQYDAELLKLVDNIKSSYFLLFEYALHYESLRLDLRKEFNKLSQEIETKIPEVQELINKRLEEL